MRHDDIRKPFTVQGDLPFVLRAFGMPEDMNPDRAHDAFSDYVARVCTATGKACMITTWHATTTGDRTTYVVQAEPIMVASPADPWVKVGTTTIDGTLVDVANVLDVSSWPIDWDRDAVATIDLFMRAQEPWLVGGRHLVAKRSHVNEHAGTAIISCDIVRRLSECCVYCDRDHLTDAQRERAGECSSCSASIAAKMSIPTSAKHICPECGPHGNRGEVLLASSWAKCTTCAGGKPGDLWGEVKKGPFPGVKRYMLAIDDLVFDSEEVEVKRGPASTQGAMSSALIAKGASSEVAQAGVRAFIDALGRPPSFDPVGHKPGSIGMPATYVEGERVVDRWGRHGVVLGMSGKLVRVQMDEGWTGLHAMCELVGKASE